MLGHRRRRGPTLKQHWVTCLLGSHVATNLHRSPLFGGSITIYFHLLPSSAPTSSLSLDLPLPSSVSTSLHVLTNLLDKLLLGGSDLISFCKQQQQQHLFTSKVSSYCSIYEYCFTSLSVQSWQYRDRRKPEAGTIRYSYFEWLQGFFIVHSTIGSTVNSMPLNRSEHCIATTMMTTRIRTWYPQVTSPSRYEWAIGAVTAVCLCLSVYITRQTAVTAHFLSEQLLLTF